MSISIQNRQRCLPVDVGRLRRSLKRLLKQLGCEESDLSLLLLDDLQIREVNSHYLQRDRPTNVISFAMNEGEFGDLHPEVLGDIIVSVETAAREAVDGNIGFMDAVEFLMIHGLLHLLGYDHEQGESFRADEMRKKERELFFLLRHYHLD